MAACPPQRPHTSQKCTMSSWALPSSVRSSAGKGMFHTLPHQSSGGSSMDRQGIGLSSCTRPPQGRSNHGAHQRPRGRAQDHVQRGAARQEVSDVAFAAPHVSAQDGVRLRHVITLFGLRLSVRSDRRELCGGAWGWGALPRVNPQLAAGTCGTSGQHAVIKWRQHEGCGHGAGHRVIAGGSALQCNLTTPARARGIAVAFGGIIDGLHAQCRNI